MRLVCTKLSLLVTLAVYLNGVRVHALGSVDEYKKDCIGTETGPSHDSSPARRRYERYRAMYTNCTHVLKNLEIVFLADDDTYDLSFLSEIREVNGYVYIVGNRIDVLPLTNLRVIRGRNLFQINHPDTGNLIDVSMFIALNNKENSTTVGLKEVHLTSLYEIMAGHVVFIDNNLLCYVDTIVWEDIFMGSTTSKVWFKNSPSKFRVSCNTACSENCSASSNGTEQAHCWGPGSDQCQQRHPKLCNARCNGRCFGPSETECCDSQCVGGCQGRSQTDCWACKNFNDNGACVEFCPNVYRYNPKTFQNDENPEGKYSYGSLCIKNCATVNMLADNGGCVRRCQPGHQDNNGRCELCSGFCEKTCPGTEKGSWVNSANIDSFADCTVIEGNLDILSHSFIGDPLHNISGLTIDQLAVFKSVRRINGYLRVEDIRVEGFTSLSFFESLSVITGSRLYNDKFSVFIGWTSLEYLGLTSLTKVSQGLVHVFRNPNLCFPTRNVWTKIARNVTRGLNNADRAMCSNCSQLCAAGDGCWGPGIEHCVTCSGYRYGQVCLSECSAAFLNVSASSSNLTLYVSGGNTTGSDERMCQDCHHECNETCFGKGADQCKSCLNYKDGPYCVSNCPITKYPASNGTCQPCHPSCHSDYGCSGPQPFLGKNGCNMCTYPVFDWFNQTRTASDDASSRWKPRQCIEDSRDCPEGFYSTRLPIDIETTKGTAKRTVDMCRKCHSECLRCTEGSQYCTRNCRNYEQVEQCVPTCSQGYYLESENSKMCFPCDEECISCTGPSTGDCNQCKHSSLHRVEGVFDSKKNIPKQQLLSDSGISFSERICVSECPDELHEFASYSEEFAGYIVCSAGPMTDEVLSSQIGPEKSKYSNEFIVGSIIAVVVCAAVIGALLFKRRKAKRETYDTMAEAQRGGCDVTELMLTNIKADMSSLRLISDSELRMGDVIGSGAFGTVYKAFWIPPNEKVKIPVAVKVLRDFEKSNDLLDEARIMSSVRHSCCIRIIAISMTAQVKLVTQLMPLGCLLDYIQRHKERVGPAGLLNWATQIADGMKYLEELGIVHRDLAARNILLQAINQIRITDFGLAKLLNTDDHIQSTGGKVPVKWLALESIQYRVFNYKTDVWSYGVTLWEIFTFGKHPYEDTPAIKMAEVLEKGERLTQPSICTIDVYMLMIKCWMVDAVSRPSFTELHDEFSKMTKDPGRYLVVQGDKLQRETSNLSDLDQIMTYNFGMGIEDDHAADAVVLSAEDYLRPQDLHRATTSLEQEQIDKEYENVGSSENTQPSCSHHKRSFHRMGSQRYSTDPCRDDEMDTAADKFVVLHRPATDETNYIEPLSTALKKKPYLDLIDENDSSTGEYANINSSQKTSAVLQQQLFADNPEYFSDPLFK